MGWEGIQATAQGREVHYMPLAGSGVPYGYSPVLLAHPDLCDSGSETLRKFLSVTERGYQYAQSNPVEAAEILLNTSDHPTLHELGLPFLESAQRFLSGDNYTVNAEGRWGRMEPEQWDAFVNWLGNNELLTARDGSIIPTSSLQTSAMFTNDFLPR
jgi:NitT/TauT family transport system substrate-binding protein